MDVVVIEIDSPAPDMCEPLRVLEVCARPLALALGPSRVGDVHDHTDHSVGGAVRRAKDLSDADRLAN
jgi:hypothetical protein